jgi:hypothetical protein
MNAKVQVSVNSAAICQRLGRRQQLLLYKTAIFFSRTGGGGHVLNTISEGGYLRPQPEPGGLTDLPEGGSKTVATENLAAAVWRQFEKREWYIRLGGALVKKS